MLCAIWYHLCNFKNVKNTYGGVLDYNFTKSSTPPWGFFDAFKIALIIPNRATHHNGGILI